MPPPAWCGCRHVSHHLAVLSLLRCLLWYCRYGVFSSQEDEEVDAEQPQWAMELASAANAAGVVSGASATGPGKLPPPPGGAGAGGLLQPFPVYDSSSSGSSGGDSSSEEDSDEEHAPGADSGEGQAGSSRRNRSGALGGGRRCHGSLGGPTPADMILKEGGTAWPVANG